MKKLMIGFLMLSSGYVMAGQSTEKETTLANSSDFMILSDVSVDHFEVFLSYAGTHFDHCGVSVRGHSFGANVEKLKSELLITRGSGSQTDISEIKNGKFVAKVINPNQMTYGENFTIKTKSGKSLEEVISGLDVYHKAEVIVEILDCGK